MGDATLKTEGTEENTGEKTRKKPVPVVIPKNVYDVQRLRLERLFAHPDKPVMIPTSAPRGAKKPHEAPEFVRNVMGSSAGAGSGEFHVYRHLRRKEYARQKYIDQQAREEEKDADYRQKLEENNRRAQERTARKRAKRLRRKQNMAKRKKEGKKEKDSGSSDEEDSTGENVETTFPEEKGDQPGGDASTPVDKDPEATGIATNSDTDEEKTGSLPAQDGAEDCGTPGGDAGDVTGSDRAEQDTGSGTMKTP